MEINISSGPGDDETPAETVIETGWATIRVGGNATVFTAEVQNFYMGGMPGQGKSGAVRWQMAEILPEIASDDEPHTPGGA